jgi:outer membrane protein OmpA-like peptidoglycan-associated protein
MLLIESIRKKYFESRAAMNIRNVFVLFGVIFLACVLSACSSKKTTVVTLPSSAPASRDALFSNSLLFPSDAAAHFYWPPAKTLTKEIRAVGGEIYQSGSFITIVLPNDALFEPSTSSLLPGAYGLIEDVAKVIVRFPDKSVIITAHTDGIGSELYQAKLSRQQAQLVALVLWQQDSIDLKTFKRFKFAGMSHSLPVTEDTSPYGQSLNRRIQITIYPSQEMEEMKRILGNEEIGQI